MKLFSSKESWVLTLTDEEAIVVIATLNHCAKNNIHATKEEKLEVLEDLKNRVIKESLLESEIEKVNQYE